MNGCALDRVSDSASLDFSRLENYAGEFRERFHAADPWPHLVIDDFLPSGLALEAASAFPAMARAKVGFARYFGGRSYGEMPGAEDAVMQRVFGLLHGRELTAILEAVSGVERLDADRDMLGAGFHQGAAGSRLRIHADHNTHPLDPSRFRRVNVMLYLNPRWEADWNGDLELWDREAVTCRARIAPKFNRAVILHVDDTAYHGYGPLRVPAGITRNALAAYYYAASPAIGQSNIPHATALPKLHTDNALSIAARRARCAIATRCVKVNMRARGSQL